MARLTQAKLFVDTGDPGEARKVQQLLHNAGYDGLDGATTNPSYFAKNPEVQARIKEGKKYTQAELLAAYREAVEELAEIIPGGDISIEVYADKDTTASEMVGQGREMAGWIQSSVIKLPITPAGLQAAELLKLEVRLNLTLCFSQAQAAAVYAATRDSKWPVFVSPFIGRLDDSGLDGTQHIGNILRMYREQGDGHVQVLSASFRRLESVFEVLHLKTNIMTINFKIFEPWAAQGFLFPDKNFRYVSEGKAIPYDSSLDLAAEWQTFDIEHNLTKAGLQKFADDWNALLK